MPIKGRENSWTIRRSVHGNTYVVQAEWIVGLEVWGMKCKANGVLMDFDQCDDPHPLREAYAMIDAAIMEQSVPVELTAAVNSNTPELKAVTA